MLVMMGTFAVLAWFGCLIDNLLLTYLIGQYSTSQLSPTFSVSNHFSFS